MQTEQNVRVYAIECDGLTGKYVVEDLTTALDELQQAEYGDKYTITVEEWDRADLDALPEFDGW